MIVRKVDLSGNFVGNTDEIAIDQVDAGIGDTVIVVKEGDAVQQVIGHKKAPVNTIIIAVVDDIDIPVK